MLKLFSHGILGMNARNLKYIKTKNSRESISLADSKLKTKHFLSSRGIPFAETYHTIASVEELRDFSFTSIVPDSFVIKPNKGSQGKGILIVRRRGDIYHIQGDTWSEDDLRLHMTDILHGSFSLHGSGDTVVIEELLVPSEDFGVFCTHGLADIRIIVYNYVPITAMIRMPTERSGGKANLAQGGIGMGLSIASGKVMSLSQDKVSHTTNFPTGYEHLRGAELSYWSEILLYSAQVQAYTKLGYLALDWVITRNGPRLLEINARAGLEIQNVNLVPLERRLSQVEGLKISSPEKGVEVAKALFEPKKIHHTQDKKILYLEQVGTVLGGREVIVTVSLEHAHTTVSHDINTLCETEDHIALALEGGIHIEIDEYSISEDIENTIILGKRDIAPYLIQPTKKPLQSRVSSTHKWPKDILTLDDAIYRLSKKINLSSLLKPENYFSEFDAYIRAGQGYNPVFSYNFPDSIRTDSLLQNLAKLQTQVDILKGRGEALAHIYDEKLREIQDKILLICAYRDENHPLIHEQNTRLFGKTDPAYLYDAKEKVLSLHGKIHHNEKILGRILSLDEVVDRVTSYFEEHHIPRVPIVIESSNLSRMSVAYGREVKIRISKNAIFREKEIDATLAHEIGTHLQRYLSGKTLGLKILQYGTGYYLADEEGFAIHQSLSHLPEGYEKNAMYIKYYLLDRAETLSFSETLDLIRSLYPDKSIESLFSDTVRLKRGIIHTGAKCTEGTTYQKDKIYLDGYMRVSRWIDEGGDTEVLRRAKIKLSDLQYFDFSHI